MASNYDKWTFNIIDTSHHKKGFTVYKVASMLYPEVCPGAVTKITVWKRYNDFKVLHRDLKLKHQNLQFRDRLPALPSNPFFKRFHKEIINERKNGILKLLNYVAKHPHLFMCNDFVKFFETSHTPSERLNGCINSIRADLQLPVEAEYISLCTPNSDDEESLSDTDSISTLGSLNKLGQAVGFLSDPLYMSSGTSPRLSQKLNSSSSLSLPKNPRVKLFDTVSISPIGELSDYGTCAKHQKILTSNIIKEPVQYIVDAAPYIAQAREMELATEYEKAFSAYKSGIDILLKYVKFDKEIDRRQMVKRKVEKYLLKAEKIYNMYLSPEIKDIQELTKMEEKPPIQRPFADLHKYKVIKVIASGMLVIHSESQQVFYVKVICKSWKFSTDSLILPNNVPYMVKLYNVYESENALFLVLQYCCGNKLVDYLKQKTNCCDDFKISSSQVFKFDDDVNFGIDLDTSYTDLVSEYVSSQRNNLHLGSCPTAVAKPLKCTEGNEESEVTNENSEECESGDLLWKSKKLLLSIEAALNTNKEFTSDVSFSQAKTVPPKELNTPKVNKIFPTERKLSDRSLYDDLIEEEHSININNVIKWSAQLLVALEKLHIAGVICCDLDLKNLLVDENGDLMLSYMYSLLENKIFNPKSDIILAPELYGFEAVTFAVDWWSYGAILYQLLTGLSLKAAHPEGVFSYTCLKIPKFVTPEGRSLLKQLLVYEPHQRLGCGVNGTEDIKTHPFFNSISWKFLG